MLTLFIDTHSKEIIIALLKDEKIISKQIINEKYDHSTLCMPTLIKVISDSSYQVKEINDIIVVNGPGSFTGERIGVTIAKTLAYTLNIPIRTITSLETYLSNIDLNQNTYLSLTEKNGYFLAQFNTQKKLITDYFYLTKNEYNQFLKNNKPIPCQNYDIELAVKYAHQLKPQNPHAVNPFYVKKIEVEK